jgi:hypothetical protein
MLFPLSDGVWGFGGLVLILLFLWTSGKYGALAALRPIGFVYFLAGLEIGIALIGAIVFLGWNAPHGRPIETRRRVIAAGWRTFLGPSTRVTGFVVRRLDAGQKQRDLTSRTLRFRYNFASCQIEGSR